PVSLHDALPICPAGGRRYCRHPATGTPSAPPPGPAARARPRLHAAAVPLSPRDPTIRHATAAPPRPTAAHPHATDPLALSSRNPATPRATAATQTLPATSTAAVAGAPVSGDVAAAPYPLAMKAVARRSAANRPATVMGAHRSPRNHPVAPACPDRSTAIHSRPAGG